MKKPFPKTVLLLMLSFPSLTALAQTPPAAAPPPPANPAGEATPAPVDPVPAGPNGAASPEAPPANPVDLAAPVPPENAIAPSPSVDERLSAVEGKLEGMDESLATTVGNVGKLSKIKVSGYIQGRFENRANSANGVNATSGRPVTTNQFLVRRARLKTLYDGTNAEFMLQIDATGAGVTLKDAEATFVDTWSPFGLRLTVGQFKWPFGYEILQSSGDREMPERSLVIRTLFPGERDRGLRLTGRYEFLRVAAALVNGTGSQDPIYPNNDSNTFKDVVGRIGADFEFLVVGVSGYYGRFLKTTLPTALAPKWTDANMDKMVTSDEITFTPGTPASYQRFRRARLGVDVQAYFDIPMVGGLALKYEGIVAKDTHLSYGAVAANPCLNTTSVGHIFTAVLNVGDFVGVVGRIDSFDPNFSKSLNDSCTAQLTAARGDRVDTFAGGFLLHVSGNLKATLTYEHIAEQNTPLANNVKLANDIFTAQLQARF